MNEHSTKPEPGVDGQSQGRSTDARRVIAALLLLVVAAAAALWIVGLVTGFEQSEDDTEAGSASTAYVAVVDAGSSGSRIYLYELAPGDGLGTIEAVFEDSGDPALSSFADDPGQAGPRGLQPLLHELDAELVTRGLSAAEVPVSVLATAGMRHVDEANPDASAAIYASVSDVISAAGHRVGEVGTITGQHEGLYSWADVNYGTGGFEPGRTPAGIVEVGGASAQVVYVAKDTAGGPDILAATVNGTTYPVLSVSFLGLGQNDARAAMIAEGGTTDNACYLTGTTFERPAPGVESVTGDYEFAECQGLYREVIEQFGVTNVTTNDGFNTATFVLVGGSVAGTLGDWGLARNSDAAEELTQAKEHCEDADWADFAAEYSLVPQQFLQAQCANSTYLGTFLFDDKGLGLTADQATPAPDADATWTRGYVLLQHLSG